MVTRSNDDDCRHQSVSRVLRAGAAFSFVLSAGARQEKLF
jgi:hypothetical protein